MKQPQTDGGNTTALEPFILPAPKRTKSLIARFAGAATGATLAVAVPHIGCLGVWTVAFIYAGASAPVSQTLTYVAAFVLGSGGLAAGLYGLRKSNKACCLIFGEAAGVRRAKLAAASIAGFIVMGGLYNTIAGRGFSHPGMSAHNLEVARAMGLTPTQFLEMCRNGAVTRPAP